MSIIEYNNFVGGLNTEANPLTFPENASAKEVNFDLNKNRSRSRRLGLDILNEKDISNILDEYYDYLVKDKNVYSNSFIMSDGENLKIIYNKYVLLILENNTYNFKFGYVSKNGKIIDCDSSSDDILIVEEKAVYHYKYKTIDKTINFNKELIPRVRDVSGIEDNIKGDLYNDTDYIIGYEHILIDNGIVSVDDIKNNNGKIPDNKKEYYYYDPDSANPGALGDINRLKYKGKYVELGYREVLRLQKKIPSPLFSNDKNIQKYFYNIGNKGWFKPVNPYGSHDKNYRRVAYYVFKEEAERLPNHSDLMQLGYQNNPDRGGLEQFRVENITNTLTGNSESPNGFYFYNPFKTSRAEQHNSTINYAKTPDAIEFLKEERKVYDKFTSASFFAGRVIFTSSSSVLFSQTITSDSNLERCYQAADPTSSVDSLIVDTDGGEIKIKGCSNIYKSVEFSSGLLIFAINGVWFLSSTDNGVFSATNYSLTKISSVNNIPTFKPIYIDNIVLFMSENGLNTVSLEPASGMPKITEFNTENIRSIFNNFSYEQISSMKVSYDSKNRKVYILVDNKMYIYNTLLKAWYIYELNLMDGMEIISLDIPRKSSLKYISEKVVDDNNNVITYLNSRMVDEEVEYVRYELSDNSTNIKLIALFKKPFLEETNLTEEEYLNVYKTENSIFKQKLSCILSFCNDKFEDMGRLGMGVDARAEIITGFLLFGDTVKNKGTKSITVHLEKTEDGYYYNSEGGLELQNQSGCKMQLGFSFPNTNFYDNEETYSWSREYNVYRPKFKIGGDVGEIPYNDKSVISTRTKILGRGRTLSFKFSSEPLKNCVLLGWSIDGIAYGGISNK